MAQAGETAGKGAGLRAYVRGTWLLLGVQLALALAMAALTYFATANLNKLNAKAEAAEQAAQQFQAKKDAAEKELAERTQKYLDAAPLIQQGVRALTKAPADPELARRFFAQAVSVNPGDSYARVLLAQTISEFFDPKDAILAYAEAAKIQPLEPEDSVRYALAQCRVGQAEAAVATAKAADAAKFLDAAKRLGAARKCPALKPVIASQTDEAEQTAEKSWAVTRIFLQIHSEEDRARAMALQKQLRELNYEVPGIERVAAGKYPKAGEIRYYYGAQKDIVAGIAALIAQVGAQSASDEAAKAWFAAPFKQVALIKPDGAPKYEGMPTDQIEVWLPPSPAQSP